MALNTLRSWVMAPPAQYKYPQAHAEFLANPSNDIHFFVPRLVNEGRFPESSLAVALFYLNRIRKQLGQHVITTINVHRLFTAAYIVAAKFVTDRPFSLNRLSTATGFSLQLLKMMEREFLQLMKWDLFVPEQEAMEFYATLPGAEVLHLPNSPAPSDEMDTSSSLSLDTTSPVSSGAASPSSLSPEPSVAHHGFAQRPVSLSGVSGALSATPARAAPPVILPPSQSQQHAVHDAYIAA